MNKDSKIYIAGHGGLAGSAIERRLRLAGYANLLTRSHSSLDLANQPQVLDFFAQERPEYVFLAAAKVGGIAANDRYPADFIRDNLSIQLNVIEGAYRFGCRKLLFLGSSCIYPKFAPQPISEEYLMSGSLEPTNEWYAIAKIAGIKMCQAYRKQYGFNAIALIPCNLYGPGDNYSLTDSHVLPALLRKMHEAKETGAGSVEIWGSGAPLREFLYSDDLADACLFLMQNYNEPEIINVGVGKEISISELAEKIKKIVGFQGELIFDRSKPDGTPRKVMNVCKLSGLGWEAQTSLQEGIESTYGWFMQALRKDKSRPHKNRANSA